MALVAEAVLYEPVEDESYDLFSEFRFGDNLNGEVGGNVLSTSEFSAGLQDGAGTSGQILWDSNDADGLDSNFCRVWLRVQATDDCTIMQWCVDGQMLTSEAPAYTSFEQLKIRVATSAQASVELERLAVEFYDDGNLIDLWLQDRVLEVDGTSLPGSPYEEQCLTVSPESSGCDEICVGGFARLSAPAGVALDANSLFGQILIDATQGPC